MKNLTLLGLTLLAMDSYASDTLEEIKIISTKIESSFLEVPASVDFISAEELKKKRPKTLEEVFNQTPNVSASLGARGSAQQIQIRGLDNTKVYISVDGARQNYRGTHNQDTYQDFDLLKSVEVIKGPGSALYGSGAVAGVVSFTTKSASDFLKSDQSIGASLSGDFNSANSLKNASVKTYGKYKNLDALLSISARDNDHLILGDGSELPYSEEKANNVFVKTGLSYGQNKFNLIYDRFNSHAFEPQDPRKEESNSNDIVRRETLKNQVTFKYNRETENFISPSLTAYYTDTDVEKINQDDDDIEQTRVETTGVELMNSSKVFEKGELSHFLTFGGEYTNDKNTGRDNGDTYDAFPDGTSRFLGAYIQYKLDYRGVFSLVPALRYDDFKISAPSQDNDKEGSKVSSKVAATMTVDEGLVFYGNFAQGYNAPRLQDLYISGMHFPGNFFVANPDLSPEKTDTFELGMRLSMDDALANDDSFFFEITGFKTKARDFIAREVKATTTQFVNKDRVDLEGIEASLSYDFLNFSSKLSYATTKTEKLEDGESLDTEPADQINFNISQELSDLGLDYGLESIFAFRQKTESVETPGYAIFNIYSNYQFKDFDLTLRVNNILDKAYRPHTAFTLNSGRDVRLSAKYRF